LDDLDEFNVLEPNNAITLQLRGNVKRMLKDYQISLKDLDEVDVLEPNNAIILQSCGTVKWMLYDY
jgi:hypothetical protein